MKKDIFLFVEDSHFLDQLEPSWLRNVVMNMYIKYVNYTVLMYLPFMMIIRLCVWAMN